VERQPSELLAAAKAAQAEMLRSRREPQRAGASIPIRPASARNNSTESARDSNRVSAASVAPRRGELVVQQAVQHKSRLAGLMTATGGTGSMSARR